MCNEKNVVVNIRMSASDKIKLVNNAQALGMTVSQYIRFIASYNRR